MSNPIVAVGIGIMVFGLVVYFDIFTRLGPIDTPRGMKRLSYALFAAGLITIISQSTRT